MLGFSQICKKLSPKKYTTFGDLLMCTKSLLIQTQDFATWIYKFLC
jgi:hypothetical protein